MSDSPEYYESARQIVEAYHSGSLVENYPMLAEAIDQLLQVGPTSKQPLQRFDIDETRLLAAAKLRWPTVTKVDVSSPYWIDINYSTIRVGVQFEGDCCFGANFNYRTGEFE